ncbi:MAG: hypothetical protein NXI31_08340 [bacterium]|nr:hypothetical protein [bacterium]
MSDSNREHEQDARIDRELRAAFAPPSASAFADAARDVVTPRGGGPRRLPRLLPIALAAAALLLLAWPVAAGWLNDRSSTSEPLTGDQLGAMWIAAYEDAASRGFQGGCCEPSFDLPQACLDRFACRIGVRDEARVAIAGSYCGLETGGCMAIIARDGALPMCVYVLPRASDPRVTLPAGSGLHLSRRKIGELVLYALAPEPVTGSLAQFVEL